MEMTALLRRLGLQTEASQVERIRHAAFHPGVPADWANLAAALARVLMARADEPSRVLWPQRPVPFVLGVAGAQGSGKSTLAEQLARSVSAAGGRAVACSLDDFYLTRAERRSLAGSVHPLLATRGVPGTHDVDLLVSTLEALEGSGPVDLPGFDKGADDRLPASAWRRVAGRPDVVVLEGWCVGAEPQGAAALVEPINDLERREDPDGRWRGYVNDALAGVYGDLWRRLHGLVYLRVPGMDAVLRWRTQQEQALPAERRMDTAALARFVAHYERITRTMLDHPPAGAALVAHLNDDHAVQDLTLRVP